MAKAQEKATASVADAIAKTVSEYFGTVGSKDELFSTADGNVFENQGFAKNHATTLEDKNVTPHNKAKAIEVVAEEEVGGAITLNEDQLELLTNGLTKENYIPLKQLADFLKLETPDKKSETIIAALTAYRESL